MTCWLSKSNQQPSDNTFSVLTTWKRLIWVLTFFFSSAADEEGSRRFRLIFIPMNRLGSGPNPDDTQWTLFYTQMQIGWSQVAMETWSFLTVHTLVCIPTPQRFQIWQPLFYDHARESTLPLTQRKRQACYPQCIMLSGMCSVSSCLAFRGSFAPAPQTGRRETSLF